MIGLFKANGIAEGAVPRGLGAIRTVRIKVAADSQRWAILSEVRTGVGVFTGVITRYFDRF